MPTSKRIEEFIRQVETNKHVEAVEAFYTEDASIQENNSTPRIGRAKLVQREREVMKKAKSIYSQCIRPFFEDDNLVIIRWKFRFDWLDGTVTEIEEIAYQRWDQDRIAEEKFFYDPTQLQPK